MGFASAAIILVFYELTDWNSIPGPQGRARWRPRWREWLFWAGFLAPPSMLFLWARPGLTGPNRSEWRPVIEKLYALHDLPTGGYEQTLDRIFLAGLALCD